MTYFVCFGQHLVIDFYSHLSKIVHNCLPGLLLFSHFVLHLYVYIFMCLHVFQVLRSGGVFTNKMVVFRSAVCSLSKHELSFDTRSVTCNIHVHNCIWWNVLTRRRLSRTWMSAPWWTSRLRSLMMGCASLKGRLKYSLNRDNNVGWSNRMCSGHVLSPPRWSCSSFGNVQFSVNVLTTGSWPSYPSCEDVCPSQVEAVCNVFGVCFIVCECEGPSVYLVLCG